MITHEGIMQYLKELITHYLPDDLKDKTSFFNESANDASTPINFIIKMLSAETQAGITNMPIQLIIESDQAYQDLVLGSLIDLATEMNEKIEDVYDAKNDLTFYCKNMFNTPVVINEHFQRGVAKFMAASMDIRLITFLDAFTSNSAKVIYGNSNPEDITDVIPYVINYSYSVVKQMETNVFGLSSAKAHNECVGMQRQLTIDFVMSNERIQKGILNASEKINDDSIEIWFVDGLREIQLYVDVLSLTETITFGDVTKISVTFVER